VAADWDAEIAVDARLARDLVEGQFPQFDGATIERFGEGWDNVAFLVGGRCVFRFPRRAISAPLIQTEAAVLPAIAAHLPAAIPAPRWIGRPEERYPWTFCGYERIAGDILSSHVLDDAAYAVLARDTGRFLCALHAIDTIPLRDGLPPDTIGRLDHAQRRPKLELRLRELQEAGLIRDPRRILHQLDMVAPTGSRALCLVHGDLYARHVLVRDGRMSGVIDWGDVHLGDPAVDLGVLFEVFPESARAAFLKAYGPVDETTMALAQYRGIYHAVLVAHYGYRIGDAELQRAGLLRLE
jgi:aminoglycoside phosphotransferase (APT) family kinase protein